jgi:hypothetical protein
MDEEGELIRRFELVRPPRSEYILAGKTGRDLLGSQRPRLHSARCGRQNTPRTRDQLVTETVFLATGLLLPIWGALPKEDLTVNRIVIQVRRVVARHVHDLYVDATLEKLGVSRKAQTDPAKIAQAILGGGTWKAPHP